MRPLRLTALSVLPLLAQLSGCTAPGSAPAASLAPADAMAALDTATLMRHVRVLAADSLLGRAPGSAGEEKTVAYLEAQFKAMGLAPGNTDGSYIQPVPLVGITVQGAPALTFTKGAATQSLRWREDYVAWTKKVKPMASLAGSELVFVGYGVEAPEFGWDDFKGLDVAGKTLVMLVNDPPLADTARFGGARMTYYGRWTYKYDQGMKHKAAGVLLVHETKPAGYPFAVVQGRASEQFDLVTPDSNRSRSEIEGWITREQATALFALAGHDFESQKSRAASPDFAPVPLGVTASVTLANTLRRVDSRNVAATLTGSDPVQKSEYVLYMAHWDHFGVGRAINGDSIYNGALDNASGTAGLLNLEAAFAALPTKPKRSIIFVAVTAEEQGLLGSQFYGVSPIVPVAKTAAALNLDGLNPLGVTSDITVIGLGASELDDYAADAATAQGRTLRPDPEPENGYYYRSDHFSLARVGVPAFYPGAGVTFPGKPEGFGMQSRARYVAEDYHKPSDEIKPTWDFSGGVLDLQLLLSIGYRVANAPAMPQWRPGNEFRAIRETSLKN